MVLSRASFLFDIARTIFLTSNVTNAVKLKTRFSDSTILRPLEVTLSNLDNVHISKNVFIHTGLILRILGDCRLYVGENTYIGPHSHISGTQGSIIIGKHVMIADGVLISTAAHKYQDVMTPVKDQGYESRGNIIIGDGCWIGEGSYILPGVRVGANSVIGANSVVVYDVPSFSVAVGSPARVIRQYSVSEKKWLDQ